MRLRNRSRVRAVGGLAVLFTAVAVLALGAGSAAAATHHNAGGGGRGGGGTGGGGTGGGGGGSTSGKKTFASKSVTITRFANGAVPQGPAPVRSSISCDPASDVPFVNPCTGPKDDGATGTGIGAPAIAAAGATRTGSGNFGTGFSGISDVLQRTVSGGHYTPPDQALCLGPASALAPLHLAVGGNTTVVVEGTNDAIAVYSTTGALLYGPLWLGDLFSDEGEYGDIGCNYDPQTQTFFFIGIGGYGAGTDLAVMNASGYSVYGVDTGESGYCFADFPQSGFDNNAFYITVNEFCGPPYFDSYDGASLYGISKSQLASHSLSPNSVSWENLGLSNPIVVLRPAIGDGTSTEYLLDSENYDYSGNTLGFWQVTRDSNITSGHGPIYLSGWEIPSESYAQPVEATSTGDGTTCVHDFGGWCSVPEAWLEVDDQRMAQVQYAGNGKLYASLSTALYVGADLVDGAAWFQVDPRRAVVTKQGYVGVDGTFLLYPSFVRTQSNTFVLDFSMTSDTLDPSTGYTTSKNLGNSWAPVTITGAGSGPHVSFSGQQPGYLRQRWGDYSAMAFDPASGDVWMADEYVPPGDDGLDDVDNWGTYVWSVSR